MKICFELTMPNRASWNGRWSGEGNLYAKVVSFTTKTAKEKAQRILKEGSFYYRWDDGWGAAIQVREIDGKESARIKRKSQGFCGYDWMVSNIISHGSCYHKKPELVN